MRKAYYAHCIAIYDTPQEARDRATIEALGFEVYDPNTPEVDAAVAERKARGDDNYMELFRELVQAQDVFVFRALPDGRIPAGVAKEMAYAREKGLPVVELPSNVVGRTVSVEETREYLHEVGQR